MLWASNATSLHQKIATDHFTLVVALEGEFYLSHTLGEAKCQAIIDELNQLLENSLLKEDGLRQYEYHISPRASVSELIDAHQRCIEAIYQVAGAHALIQNKPYADQPACGLHVHLHAEGANGERLYHKKGDDISRPLNHSLAGLMAHMEEAAALLLKDSDTGRYSQAEDHVATTISWGSNNRSTAIRLPDSEPDQKRIEYRIAPADAEVGKLLSILFASILDGLNHQLPLPPAIHGNASDAQYGLTKLPKNMDEVEQVLAQKFKLRHFLA